jgi:hypothetical protein
LVTNLLPEHSIFFNEVIDDVVLVLIHPAGDTVHYK